MTGGLDINLPNFGQYVATPKYIASGPDESPGPPPKESWRRKEKATTYFFQNERNIEETSKETSSSEKEVKSKPDKESCEELFGTTTKLIDFSEEDCISRFNRSSSEKGKQQKNNC